MNLFESKLASLATPDNTVYLEAVSKIFNILFESEFGDQLAEKMAETVDPATQKLIDIVSLISNAAKQVSKFKIKLLEPFVGITAATNPWKSCKAFMSTDYEDFDAQHVYNFLKDNLPKLREASAITNYERFVNNVVNAAKNSPHDPKYVLNACGQYIKALSQADTMFNDFKNSEEGKKFEAPAKEEKKTRKTDVYGSKRLINNIAANGLDATQPETTGKPEKVEEEPETEALPVSKPTEDDINAWKKPEYAWLEGKVVQGGGDIVTIPLDTLEQSDRVFAMANEALDKVCKRCRLIKTFYSIKNQSTQGDCKIEMTWTPNGDMGGKSRLHKVVLYCILVYLTRKLALKDEHDDPAGLIGQSLADSIVSDMHDIAKNRSIGKLISKASGNQMAVFNDDGSVHLDQSAVGSHITEADVAAAMNEDGKARPIDQSLAKSAYDFLQANLGRFDSVDKVEFMAKVAQDAKDADGYTGTSAPTEDEFADIQVDVLTDEDDEDHDKYLDRILETNLFEKLNEMVKEVQDNADTNMTDIEYNDNAAQVVTMSMNDAKDMTPQRSTGSYVDDAAMDSSVAADLLTGKTTVADTTAGSSKTVANSLSRRRGR